jgi:hypothetical protein
MEIRSMKNKRLVPSTNTITLRQTARLLSIVTCDVFLLIMLLAITNEDQPAPLAILVLALLGLVILSCVAAWRWEKTGGMVIVGGAVCLTVAALVASLSIGMGAASILAALVYGAPFLAVGSMFWISGSSKKRGRV